KPDLKERIGLEINEALAQLPEHKRLSDYQIWETEFPRTATGKLRRGEIAAAYGGKRKPKADETARHDDLVWDSQASAISKIIAEVLDPEILRAISPSGSHVFAPNLRLVNDLGLDSLARVELASRLSGHLSADVSEEMIDDARTVEDLIVLAKAIKTDQAAETGAGSVCGHRWTVQPWPARHYGIVDWPALEDPFVVAARRTFGVALKTTAAIFNELETAGADRLVIDPPYIVAANHGSKLDTLALMACFPVNLLRLVHPVEAADELFADPLRAAAAAYLLNAISYERHGSLKPTLT